MGDLSLYNITNKFTEIMDKVETGELTELEYNEMGEELALLLKQKSSNIIGYIRNIEVLINAMSDEEKRIASNRKALENKLEKFKSYIKDNMEKLELPKIDTEIGTISLVKNPISVEIINETDVPSEFKKEYLMTKIDKTAIKNHFIETGEIPTGTKIINDKKSVRIK